MAMYRCWRCDCLRDGDYDVCTEDPDTEYGLMCEECAAGVQETPKVRQGGVFTADQLAFIKKMEQCND